MENRVVVILSGGLDSTTCLALAHDAGCRVFALTFDYGQRHRVEIEAARRVARYYRVMEHRIVELPFLRTIGGSALTDDALAVPMTGLVEDQIPVTYVPARNLIFLSVAAAYAETLGASAVYLGVNALDYSGYPDCRPEFIAAFAQTARLGTKAGVNGAPFAVETPLLSMSKADIVRLGTALLTPYELTSSCYLGGAIACGVCDSCRLRRKGFAEAGLPDPLQYASP